MAGMSPTQRTMRVLRDQGFRCAIVEKFNAYIGPHGIRQDLFNIIDVLALDPVGGVLGVQCCAGSGFSAHLKKLTEDHAQESLDWLTTNVICPHCGGKAPATQLQLWGWRKVKVKAGGKAMVWRPRVQVITLADIN